MPSEPPRPTPSRPAHARFSVRSLLVATTLFAIAATLVSLLPTPFGKAVVAAARVGIVAAIFARAWTSRGPVQVGWGAALLPWFFPDMVQGLQAALPGALYGLGPAVVRPLIELTSLCLASGLSWLVGRAVARRYGPPAPPPPPPLPPRS